MASLAYHRRKYREALERETRKGKARAKKELEEFNDKRKGLKKDYGNTYKNTNIKKPLPRYKSSIEYDFLKYIRVVFKWAVTNYDITRPQAELLLYLYGLGAFSTRQFNDYHKIMSMYPKKTLTKLLEGGWIKVWRPANRERRQPKLYTLTNRARIMCNKMHKYSMGAEDIPTSSISNAIADKDSGVRINRYYMDIIKKMNKDKQKKD